MELVITTNENMQQVVSARELHEKLESKERFSKWFDRMISYGFEEITDFTGVQKSTLVNNGAKQELQDYFVSIEMGKQICMLAKNEHGTKFRKYFIEVEKSWNNPEQVMARALKIAQKTISDFSYKIETLSLENKNLINENDLLTGKASRQEYLSVIHGFVKTIQNELQLQNGWIVLYDTCTKIDKKRIDKYYLNYCEVNKVELKAQGYKRADLSSGVKCISTFATNEQLTELFKIGKRIIEDKKIVN